MKRLIDRIKALEKARERAQAASRLKLKIWWETGSGPTPEEAAADPNVLHVTFVSPPEREKGGAK